MKKSVYKSAMSHVKTSENFEQATMEKLLQHMEQEIPEPTKSAKERFEMKTAMTKKSKVTAWAVGAAACAVLAAGILSLNPNNGTTEPVAQPTASTSQKPPIMGKMAVNIDGIISEVSADGKSFKVGDLWVTVTDQTTMGSTEPGSTPPSEEFLQKEFKVGNAVSGFTTQDVSTGKVTADAIYNNFAPQSAESTEPSPAIKGKAMVNIDGEITEVSADGKSFKVGDLWVTITPDTQMGIDGPTAAEPSDELLQKDFKVGNIVSGYTSDDVSTGKVNATRIYNNMAPQK
ncbi:DUF5666 domain-containing protein [Paenibacillus sp. NFR01]|uniref:DUF5666 domain-containing protein n=1 Tax=Paenibacillus sp. NFR01 TaxID=1566279 RepID=UPI0008B1F08C|nr:DUF5666 domain-containing protein [Paenibacillus sp. NFR01]SET14231.1 hypothetical protein SAMN03159358_0833 [Paenibacillus sp. NFR01]